MTHWFTGLALASIIGLASCGSDDVTSSTVAASAGADATVPPEDIRVDPAVVTAGLTKLPSTIASAIAAIGTPGAGVKGAAIEEEWATFEGTVRNTDQDIYLAIEDQLHPLRDQIKAGDSATATKTAATLSALFSQYLTKHPG
ncbi:MAG: hypothetical protein ABI949_07400 [Ilumatobacteraceae bacterium]